VRRSVKEFKEGRKDVFDEKRSGSPSLVSEKVVEKIDNVIRKDRQLTLDGVRELIPDILRVGGRDLQGGYTKVDP